MAIYLCREVGAKPLAEIGGVLRIKGSAVSLAAKRLHQRSGVDRGLRKKLEAAKNELLNVSKSDPNPPHDRLISMSNVEP